MYEIYVVSNAVNGKKYVGQTCCGVAKRWLRHVASARRGDKPYFLNAIRKYSPEAFSYAVVAEADGREQADFLERMWILMLDTMNPLIGYNSTVGGEGFACGDMNPQRLNPRCGEQAANYGRTPSPEVRARISKTLMGKLVGEKNPFYGRRHTEETKKLIGDQQRGQVRRPHSEETRDKIRQRMLNRVFSPETREKMGEAKRGIKLSPEFRAKLKVAQAARRQREAEAKESRLQGAECPS